MRLLALLGLFTLVFSLSGCDSATPTLIPVTSVATPTATISPTISLTTVDNSTPAPTTSSPTPIANPSTLAPTRVSTSSVSTNTSATAGRTPKQPAWIELGQNGSFVARTVTTTAACPVISINGTDQIMDVRAKPSPNYEVLICEANVPNGTKTVAVGGQTLRLLDSAPRKVAVIGDTGCRLETGQYQACNDPQAWLLKKIAASIAAWQPDLIIHVGDYVYRETPCPAGNAGCVGSPSGYKWETWNADVFTPLADLLPTAPWIFVRGNHEICSRAGQGWFLFLDPRGLPTTCQDTTEPYSVELDNLQILVLDSAIANDTQAPSDLVSLYSRQFAELKKMAGPNAWLLSHKPLRGILETATDSASGVGNATLLVAAINGLPPGVKLLLSGHIHLGEELGFTKGQPPQFIMGGGGTFLDSPVTGTLAGKTILGQTLSTGKVLHQNGFMGFEALGSNWKVTLFGPDGKPQTSCNTADLDLICNP